MPISPTTIRDSAALLSAAAEGFLDETPLVLTVKGVLTAESLTMWRQVAHELPASGFGSLAAKDTLDADVDLTTVPLAQCTDAITLLLKKTVADGSCRFFFGSCISTALYDERLISTTAEIAVGEPFPRFSTSSCVFRHWDGLANGAVAEDLDTIDPRKYVRDLTGERLVPSNVGIFILKGKAEPSGVFDAWMKVAIKRLPFTLVNEVWKEGATQMVSLTGPRIKKIPLGQFPQDSSEPEVFELLQKSAEWVYGNPREIEVRHTLFTNELAREWPENEPFYAQLATRLPRALDAATTAYRAHIREGSKDTLKSLSDLRKTLSEEVSKVSAQTRDLISSLWKDFAIAATALLSKVALIVADKKAAADSSAMKAILMGTAVFIVSNLYINLRANERFLRISRQSRDAWKSKLYGFLASEDLDALANTPLNDSEAAYRKAKRLIIALYLAIVLSLVASSFPRIPEALFASMLSALTRVRSVL
jgi:hypothetical protein